MTSVEHFEDSAEHEAREREVVKGGEGLRESFVVSGQAAESCGPSSWMPCRAAALSAASPV
jgi:hypothetical protein